MQVDTSKPREVDMTFDDLRKILMKRGPRKKKFLKSTRCRVLVIIGILLALGVIALMTTTYTIAFTATTSTIASTATTASTSISLATTSTVYTPTYQRITNSGDQIWAIYNASVGTQSMNSNSGYGVGDYAPGQGPTACIDFANTTYLNYGNVGQNLSAMTNTAGVGTGVHTIPLIGASIVLSIQFQAGNNSADRDPLTITLEGSNATGTNLNIGSYWTSLYSGATGLTSFNVTRLAWGDLQNFTNTQSFTAYRMLVTTQRGVDYCTEFAEMHLYGIV